LHFPKAPLGVWGVLKKAFQQKIETPLIGFERFLLSDT